ncbi:hypothetical protein TcCL_NonESM10665 [Trypanosoma cruzi]|nr:hypothetical protein TcCL_NonESM10665 [Trypanosoma cruzi]
MHAALRCLGMRVRLRVTEEGNARCAPCTAEATITWVAPPYDEGNVIFRDHAQLCTISATSGRLLPVVPWDGDVRGCGAGRFHWHLLNKLCYGHPSPIQRALGPAVAHHRRMWTRLLPRSIRRRRRRRSPPVPRRQRCALAQRHRGCAAGGGEERDLPDIDDVAADGVASVVEQSLGDEAVSDEAGGGATATGPKGPDAADDAQGAVDPPPREDEAAVVRGVGRQT